MPKQMDSSTTTAVLGNFAFHSADYLLVHLALALRDYHVRKAAPEGAPGRHNVLKVQTHVVWGKRLRNIDHDTKNTVAAVRPHGRLTGCLVTRR